MGICVYTASLSGHRKSYLDFVSNILPSKRVEGIGVFLSKSPVLFLMIEDSFFLYFIVCMVRSLLGKKTAGFLFRPRPVIENRSLRLKIKKWVLIIFKKLPLVKTILIVPNTIHPGFDDISDGWIYDFQFWDLQESDYKSYLALKNGHEATQLSSEINDTRVDRSVICALGAQNKIKGFDVFANTYVNNQKIQEMFLFVVGGGIKGFADLTMELKGAGGVVKNRFVSDDELLVLYASSDLIWVLYSEDYDQASGIFGRAVQFGIPVVVRKDSLIHKVCESEGIRHFAMTRDDTDSLVSIRLQPADVEQGKKYRDRFREKSIKQLNEILGILVVEAPLDR